MKTSNPVLKNYAGFSGRVPYGEKAASFRGVVNKSAITLLSVVLFGVISFFVVPDKYISIVSIVFALAAFGLVLVISFMKTVSVPLIILYAAFEGLFLGAISKFFENRFPGIAINAVAATFVVALLTLFVYKVTGVRIGSKFRKMVFIGTASLAVLYFANFILSLFHVHTGVIEIGGNAGMLSIAISAFAVILATFNLVVDFDNTRVAVERQLPEKQEWILAFGLTVTLVWLYFEMLRILSYFYNPK